MVFLILFPVYFNTFVIIMEEAVICLIPAYVEGKYIFIFL